jgi:hypothetical protein
LGEHRPYKPRVTGSSPVPPTNKFISCWPVLSLFCPIKIGEKRQRSIHSFRGCSSVWLERRPVKPEVASSSLVTPATTLFLRDVSSVQFAMNRALDRPLVEYGLSGNPAFETIVLFCDKTKYEGHPWPHNLQN